MTDKQIEELRIRLHRARPPNGFSITPDRRSNGQMLLAVRDTRYMEDVAPFFEMVLAALPRLLDEREKLLAALEQLQHTIVLRREDAEITGPAIIQGRAAIAFAKAET